MDIQKQVRENAEDLQNFLLDLNSWEKEMRKKEEDLKLAQISEVHSQEVPPIRNSLSRSKKKNRHKKQKDRCNSSPTKRIPGSDYKAWDEFDVEKELQKMDVGDEEKKDLSASDNSEEEEEYYVKKRKQLAILNKDKGNEFFKQGDYDTAINCYTTGMQLDPENPLLAANRAMALIKKEQFQAAENDCTLCLDIDPTYVKAYLRRGTARSKLRKYDLAKEDFLKVLDLESDNKQAQLELKKLSQEMSSDMEIVHTLPGTATQQLQHQLLDCTDKNNIEEPSIIDQMKDIFAETKPVNSVKNSEYNTMEDPLVKVEVPQLNENRYSEKIEYRKSPSKDEPMNFRSTEIENIVSVLEQTLPPVPTASFQFLTDWQKISRYPDLKYQYLKQLPPEKLAVIFRHSMEPQIFPDILHTLSSSFVDNGDDVFDYLKYLAEVGRFNTMLMFLSTQEQQDLKVLLEYVKESERSPSSIEQLLKIYKF